MLPHDSDPQAAEVGPVAPAAAAFPIVGIGASAGGLEALEALTRRLSAGGMAFIVVQHLSPGHDSALTDILARGTGLRVATVADGMPVQTDHIYVTPPNVEVAIHHRVLRVMPPEPDRRGPRPSIDAFFRTLAADVGSLAVGVVLSGAGSDGTLGLEAIKEENGITFAQDPASAAQPSMPQSAVDAGAADFTLRPEEIGDELARLAVHPYVVARRQTLFDDDTRSKLFVLLRGAFGVDFAAYKPTTIERRIQRRMLLHKLERLEDYLTYLRATPAELQVLYSDLLIGVTAFFRDKEPFEALRALVFPRLLENRPPGLPLRIWVPGCASGEEAYSIAICLLEHLGDRATACRFQIFATDIDDHALARGRLGIYPPSIEIDVSPHRLQRFFSRTDKGYQVHRVIRDMVVFARHNLGKDPPFSRIDLVSCRNVLIYLQPPLQKKVLRVFHYALAQDGFLLLGISDSVSEASDLFALTDRKVRLYTRRNVATSAALDIAPGVAEAESVRARPAEHRPAANLTQLADRKVIEQYGPPGVVVNDAFDIVQYRGKTGRFFEPVPGPATTSLMKLVRPELLHPLRPALHKARQEGVRVVSEPVRLGHGADATLVRLDVTPLGDPGGAEKTLLVLFRDQLGADLPAPPAPSEVPPTDTRLDVLEHELVAAKEYLQSTVEELEAANEELQSANEELQSANEELQSTNEELETSKEELQSTNEELVTLNEELQSRMAQLHVSNDDLQNLLGAASSALLLVGADLRIRRFSSAAEKLLNLIPGDAGRPIAYLRSVIQARDIEHTVGDAIKAMAPQTQRVRSIDGYWYLLHITPYRTVDSLVRGAVLELIRHSGEEREPRTPHDVDGLGGAILAAVPHALAVLDPRMCVVWANGAFFRRLRVQADILGRPLEDLWSGRVEQPTLWKLIERAVLEGRPFQLAPDAGSPGDPLAAARRVSATPLARDGDAAALTLIAIEDKGTAEG